MIREDYDVILIGSGIGSLAAGSLLAQVGNKKILILERHFKIGGFTHTFRRKGSFEWDVGVHYIGGLGEGSILRQLFDTITDSKVKWQKMPEPFEKFHYPDLQFSVYGDKLRYLNDLIELFPEERKSLEKYFEDVQIMNQWISRHFTLKAMPSVFSKAAHLLKFKGDGYAEITTKEYLDRNFSNYKLKALLCSQWGDYGLPPSQSAFAIHCLIVAHYFEGGYFPIGSSGKIAEAIEPIIESKGGKIEINHEVTGIILENDKAIGVRVAFKKGKEIENKEFYASQIISDAGSHTTYTKLLPPKYSEPFRKPLEELSHQGTTSITLYIGFSKDPRELGFKGENYWIYPDYDHDALFEKRNELIQGKPPMIYLSFPSLKNPDALAYTGEAITFADYSLFAAWKDKPWKKRGQDYEDLKNKIAESMLDVIEDSFPGFRDIVEFAELSTPLTNEHFTGHKEGSIYGLSCTPLRFQQEWIGNRTPVENLFLTGADSCSPGIGGALMGGVGAASLVLGFTGALRLIREAFSKSS